MASDGRTSTIELESGLIIETNQPFHLYASVSVLYDFTESKVKSIEKHVPDADIRELEQLDEPKAPVAGEEDVSSFCWSDEPQDALLPEDDAWFGCRTVLGMDTPYGW